MRETEATSKATWEEDTPPQRPAETSDIPELTDLPSTVATTNQPRRD